MLDRFLIGRSFRRLEGLVLEWTIVWVYGFLMERIESMMIGGGIMRNIERIMRPNRWIMRDNLLWEVLLM